MEPAIQLRDETGADEASFDDHPLGSNVVGVRERGEARPERQASGFVDRISDELAGVASPPSARSEEVGCLQTPARVERILVETPETDDVSASLLRDHPRRAADLLALSLVPDEVVAQRLERRLDMGEPHRLRVAHEL